VARWIPSFRRSKAVEPDVTKSAGVPASATFTPAQVAALLGSVSVNGQVVGQMNPLPRTDPMTAFGPGVPLIPAPLDPVRQDSGRPEPRLTEYQVSTNLPGITDRLVPWKVLRDAAGAGGLARRCIEIRKNEVATLDWTITIEQGAAEKAQADNPGMSRAEIEAELGRRLGPEIARCTRFWEEPNPREGENFAEWISKLLEEHLVLDAIAIYPRRTYGGDLYSLEVIDGSCYSDDTEVLTKRGWIRFSETESDDYFATRNPKTHEFEWQQATYFHQAPWEEDLYHFNSKSLDILVTGNHRMLVTQMPRALGGSRHRERGEVIVTAADLAAHGNGQASKIPMTSQWTAPDLNEFRLAASGRTNSMPFECSGDDFAAFMGAYLAEGCTTGEATVSITQDPKSKGFEPYRAMLTRIFGREVCHTGKSFVISRRCLRDYLTQFGKAHEKYMPDVVKSMSARQLEIFWRFYMLGDGCYDGNRQTIVTSSPRMAGDLQEIAQKIGKCANVGRDVSTTDTVMRDSRVIRAENKRARYTIRLSNTQARTWNVTRVPYKGDVFCVSVPNEVLYVRRNGKAAWCGNTIKVLRDNTGGRPQPPQPAFQQILWGFPRGEFVADTDDQGNVLNGYRSDHLIYKRRNVRTFTQYGYSAVEQALEDIDVWLRRRKWIRDEYTEGTVPTGMITNAGLNGWTAEQIREYERDLNDVYSGQTAERHRLRILPPGFQLETAEDFAEKYRPDYDLYLIKQIAAHFDVTIAELGFTETGGLGSTGWHEGQADVQHRKATLPTLRWLQQLITVISRKHLGMPPELEFRFLGLEEEDEAAADQVAQQRIQWGRMTLNEDRDRLGLPRYPFAEADMAMVMTTRGVVFLEGAAESATPGIMLSPGGAGTGDGDEPNDGAEGDQETEPADTSRPEAVKAELAAFHRWSKRNPHPRRPFTFEVVTKADAPDLLAAPVVFATPGGDEDPKGELVAWPGWDRDQDTATVWAARIQQALADTVDCEQLAERWLAQELVKADVDQFATALAAAFLTAQSVNLGPAIARMLTGIWTEGWAIGAHSARSLLDRARARFPWRKGDQQAAEHTLTTAAQEALRAFRDRSASIARTVTEGRIQVLANVLAGARPAGMNVTQLARALRDALADPAFAYRLALTETVRASTQAARDTYTTAGVTRWKWLTEPGACPICTANAAAESRTIGEMWPDGSEAPPAHPNCRCSIAPA
jgi:hypothetical protein